MLAGKYATLFTHTHTHPNTHKHEIFFPQKKAEVMFHFDPAVMVSNLTERQTNQITL